MVLSWPARLTAKLEFHLLQGKKKKDFFFKSKISLLFNADENDLYMQY